MTIKQIQAEAEKRGHRTHRTPEGIIILTTKSGHKLAYNSYNHLNERFLKPVTEPKYPQTVKIKKR